MASVLKSSPKLCWFHHSIGFRMTHRRYLVAYDICDPSRLRKVATLMESYGSRIQFSIFECALSLLMRAELEQELKLVIKPSDDQILFIDLGDHSSTMVKIESVGRPYSRATQVTIV